jgi:hypothetical protein
MSQSFGKTTKEKTTEKWKKPQRSIGDYSRVFHSDDDGDPDCDSDWRMNANH